MDLASPDKLAVDNINPHEDDISNVGKLDLNLEMRKETGGRHGHENEALGRTQVDLNHQHHGSSSLHAIIVADKPDSPYYKSSSQVQYGLLNGNETTEDTGFNGERTHSCRGGEHGVANGGYSERSRSPVEAANFQPELEMDDSACLLPKFSPEMHLNYQLDDIKEKSHHHEVLTKSSDKFSGDLQHERTKFVYEVTEQEGTAHLMKKECSGNDMKKEYSGNDTLMEDEYSGKPLPINGEDEGRNAEVHASGRTSTRSASPMRASSFSPVRSPTLHGKLPYSPQGNRYSLHSSRSCGRKISPSPERTAGNGHPSLSARRTSPSPGRRSRRESPRRDASLRKRLSSSPRMPQVSTGCQRQNRSVSRSPASPERTGGSSRRVLSEDHPSLSARQASPSPRRRSRRESPYRDESLGKQPSSSPRRHYVSPERRRPDKSVSRSPIRHRDSSYGSRRDYRDRSRSRSPRARDHYRSPRRYSPRRRSPPGYYARRRSPRRKPWSPPRNRNNGVGRPGNSLFVAGFSFATTERDLERKFSRFGRVRDVRIVRDKRSGDSRGFGFLSLERDEDADAAIRALDQTDWNGRVVLVEKSKTH